jgi:putative acetyltransferase
MIVEAGNPHDPQATALLQASHALMEGLYPPEDNHFLSIDALCMPDVHFFVARDSDQTLGCGAFKTYTGYAEVKSMFTSEAARGKGVADALLTKIITQARALNVPFLRLETGDTLFAAHRLYARHGFTTRGPFGDYPESPSSLFMEKTL